MIIPNKFNGYSRDGIRLYHLGGGGGGQTTSTVQNTNVPEYARPYVETMLGATQNQLFNTEQVGGKPAVAATYDSEGNVLNAGSDAVEGYTKITGFKPYQAYGGTYDAQGRQLSYDPSAAIAGFSPMQLQAQQGIMGMQAPGQFGEASRFVGDLGQKMAGQTYDPTQFQKYQMNGVDDVTTSKFDQAAADQYMNPYMQSVVDIQKREANRQAGQMASQNAAKFAGAGAFGGSRQAVAMAEADRNLSQQMGDIQATGSNQAYQQALQQFNADQGRSLAAAQGNQAKNLSMGQANLQALLSTQAQQEQAKQFGAGYGLQSQQAALGAARDYANYGQMGFNAQKDIYGLQNQTGAQQQQYQQSIINQAMLDYANAQQYPMMQLGAMSNMLRGLPMQSTSTNQYQAQPNQLTQAIGALGAGSSIYNAYTKPGGAAGGLPREFKYSKGGGIMSYDMGGEVEAQLENMSEEQLQTQAKESSSPSIRKMAQRILRERQMSSQPQGISPMGAQYQAPPAPGMRGGGIIAFKRGGDMESAIEEGGDEEARIGMAERLAMPPVGGGIMGAAPVTPPSAASQAVQRSASMPEFMKADYEAAEKRAAAPLSDFMTERKAAMEAAGVADTAEGQQQQRAELMAEKASMKEEKDRQRYLRMAEFFASWGSTPGPTLVAGMNALKQAVPGIISDEKEQKKAQREINKSIADLDNATRLEKRGEIDAAMVLKQKAADDMKALNMKFIDYQSKRESDENQAKTSKYDADTRASASRYTADLQYKSEQLRANTARLDRLASRATAEEQKAFGQYQTAANQEQRVIAKISDQASSGQYKKDLEDISSIKMTAADEKGNFDPTKVPAPLRTKLEAAETRVKEQQEVWNKQKETAARDTQLAYERVRLKPEATAAGSSASATNTTGLETRDFAAPTPAHIAALKANPSQKAAFDAKFGPGAANEYLGK